MVTPYVVPVADAGLAQPGHLESVTLYLFALETDRDRLQRLLDRTFVRPSAGAIQCQAAADFIVLACTAIDWLREDDPERGHVRYDDIAFWLPAKLARAGAPAISRRFRWASGSRSSSCRRAA